jgi:alkylation response protein AidB-like acyl-CoA dehydrogenase
MRSALWYQPNQDQVSLVGGLEAPVAALLKVSRLHKGASGEDEATWRQLSELGVLTAGLDEAHGGIGLGAAELALIAIALGNALASPSVFATMTAVGAAQAAGVAPDTCRVAAAFGDGAFTWIDEPGANLLLVRTATGAALHTMPVSPKLADETTWGARLMSGTLGKPLGLLDGRETLLMRLIDAAALAGIAEATLAMAVAYAKMREQFGRPIGSFQAVKHHCANMAIAARSARDLTTFAAVAIDTGRDEAVQLTESAVLIASRAAMENAGTNIQIHGGIGFSDEADPHLFLKRAQLITSLGGGIEAAAQRVADAGTT